MNTDDVSGCVDCCECSCRGGVYFFARKRFGTRMCCVVNKKSLHRLRRYGSVLRTNRLVVLTYSIQEVCFRWNERSWWRNWIRHNEPFIPGDSIRSYYTNSRSPTYRQRRPSHNTIQYICCQTVGDLNAANGVVDEHALYGSNSSNTLRTSSCRGISVHKSIHSLLVTGCWLQQCCRVSRWIHPPGCSE